MKYTSSIGIAFSLVSALLVGTGCGKGAAAAKEVEDISARICACKDAECAKKGFDDLNAWQTKHADTRGSEDDIKRITAAATKAAECAQTLMAAPAPTPTAPTPATGSDTAGSAAGSAAGSDMAAPAAGSDTAGSAAAGSDSAGSAAAPGKE